MNRAPCPQTLRIDPNARIIATADELRVSGRRGVFLIRGKGIRSLHQRMGPWLDGRFTDEQLLAAAGDKRGAVRRYLNGLKQAGALSDGADVGPLPSEFPSAIAGVQTLRLGDLSIVVSLDRLLEPRRHTLLVHVGPADQVEWLLLDRRRLSAGTTEIVIEIGQPDIADSLANRARIARHLLAVALGGGSLEGGMSIYKAGPGLTLRRRAVMRPGENRQISVWTQMNIVHQADMRQTPLAVFSGELPGQGRGCLGIGLSAREVEPRVLLHIVARTYLSIAASRNQCISGSIVSTLSPRENRPVNIVLTPAKSERATFGLTRSDCLQALLCSYALQHLEVRPGRRCDLLKEVPLSPRVSMLQRLLRLRREACEGCLDDQSGPVVVFRGHGMEVARLGCEATVAEALVRAIAAEYYGSVTADVVAVPGMEEPSSERRRLYRALRSFPGPVSFSVSRVRRLGLTFHVGLPLEAPSVVPDSDKLPDCGTRKGGEDPRQPGKESVKRRL